jgi:parallel beta-helix repeat protein
MADKKISELPIATTPLNGNELIPVVQSNLNKRILVSDLAASVVGPTGATGDMGPIGPTGADGNAGLRGPTGDTGLGGAMGPTGSDGALGPTGADGVGSLGPTGAAGADGALGPTGADGATGAPGAAGGDVGGYALSKIEALRTSTADVILTTTNAADLNTAIAALTDGQILEIQTSAAYSPIIIPSGKSFQIKVSEGYAPTVTGQECIKIENGADDIVISGLIVENCTTSYQNGKGSAITFKDNHSKCNDIIFHNITIRNAQGSGVLLAYYNYGDYATAPTLSEMSTNLYFVECHFHKATTDIIEGGSLCLRGINNALILKCDIDSANLGRGMNLQNSINLVVAECFVCNCNDGNGGEGIKLDALGTPVGYRNSAIIKSNVVKRCIEGIDLDDATSCNVIQNNIVSECVDEGISLDGGAGPNNGIATITGNVCFKNGKGIHLESGSIANLKKNVCFENTSNYSILNGYSVDDSNTTSIDDVKITTFATIVKNDSSVSGTTIKDALDALNTTKQKIDSGATRPASPIQGQMFFDTNLGTPRPIWYIGTGWVDATGNSV